MKTIRTILRAFVLGTVAGLLIAPRAGRETREMLLDRWNNLMDNAGMEGGGQGAGGGTSV